MNLFPDAKTRLIVHLPRILAPFSFQIFIVLQACFAQVLNVWIVSPSFPLDFLMGWYVGWLAVNPSSMRLHFVKESPYDLESHCMLTRATKS